MYVYPGTRKTHNCLSTPWSKAGLVEKARMMLMSFLPCRMHRYQDSSPEHIAQFAQAVAPW